MGTVTLDSKARREMSDEEYSADLLKTLQRQAQTVRQRGEFSGSSVQPALEVIVRLQPDAMSMARGAHEEIVAWIVGTVQDCGSVDAELVPLVNGLKKLVEFGPWAYQDGGWQSWPPPEVAK